MPRCLHHNANLLALFLTARVLRPPAKTNALCRQNACKNRDAPTYKAEIACKLNYVCKFWLLMLRRLDVHCCIPRQFQAKTCGAPRSAMAYHHPHFEGNAPCP
mmetsp:Transcript_26327/g.51585  ORF Transcript_26327/g.51585 Transcript_26327/m.51585 type:complete len:103 (-) Transcript_26327:656-964(-)